jgi:predicted DNA-binding transcriptional regulator YafY
MLNRNETATFFDDMIGVSKDINDKPKEITFLATEKQSKYIETKPLHKSQKLLNRDIDGYCTFSINVVLNFELYSVLMSYGSGIKILSPKRVERYMKRMSEQMYDLYH